MSPDPPHPVLPVPATTELEEKTARSPDDRDDHTEIIELTEESSRHVEQLVAGPGKHIPKLVAALAHTK